MNKLNVLIGNNTWGVLNAVLGKLKENQDDMALENIVIVPDRLSLVAEQCIFDALGIDVYFNIEVMGISKFAKKIIAEAGLEILECSALESKLLVFRAMQNVKEKLNCFSGKFTFGLVDEIYAKIEQIKSSGAKIDELLDDNATKGTKLKFEDIKTIFLEYEKLRGEKIDSGDLLDIFNKVASSGNLLKNCNVYFAGFDSLTKQGIRVLNNVAKNAHNTYVGVVAPYNQKNGSLYDKTFLNGIIELCKLEKFESEMIWLDLSLKNKTADIILKNAFDRSKCFESDGYITTYKAAGQADEIDFVVKSINYNLKTKGINFKDIAICAPQEVQDIIKIKLELLGISAYVDKNYKLTETEPVKFILSYLKYLENPFDKENFLNVVNNEFCPLAKEQKEVLNNLVNKFNSVEIVKKQELNEELKLFLNDFEMIDKNNLNINYYFEIINKIIKKYQILEKINDFCLNFKENGEIALQKLYLQIEEKFNKLIGQLQNVLSGQMEYLQFLELFEKALCEQELIGVPSTINEVFIGDYKSFYFNVKYLYIVSANEGVFPNVLADTGLISDKEICSNTIKAKLEPTTKIINKRNKFKAFEVILSASEKCYLIYHNLASNGKRAQESELVGEINRLLNLKEIDVNSLKFYESGKLEINKICFNNENVYNANLNLRKSLQAAVSAVVLGALIKDDNLFVNKKPNVQNINYSELFFKDNQASVSLVEKYYACPKSAFLAYGLRLKKNKEEKVEANILGSFIHEVCEKFVKQNKANLGKMTDEEIENSAIAICNSILAKDDFYMLRLEENIFILELIKKEAKRLCKFLNYEQSVSKFKVKYEEKRFSSFSDFKPLEIEVDGKTYFVGGIIDRIDECENDFRIIDYKSGNTTNAKGKEMLFYGTKIQLFVYASAIQKNLNKNLYGVFYLPIKNTFCGEGKEDYYLSGFFTGDVSLAMKSDSTLNLENKKSKILGCGLNKPDKNGEICLTKKENILLEEELKSYLTYSLDVFKSAIRDINAGFVECLPFSGKCDICEFSGICKNAHNKKLEREGEYDIKKSTFLEINNGN